MLIFEKTIHISFQKKKKKKKKNQKVLMKIGEMADVFLNLANFAPDVLILATPYWLCFEAKSINQGDKS